MSSGPYLTIVLGTGGVGKTTLSAALGIAAAVCGKRTLVMTIDPSQRLLQALQADDTHQLDQSTYAYPLPASLRASWLHVSVLDAQAILNDIIYAQTSSPEAAARIIGHPLYQHLCGRLVGFLELAAIEKLYSVLHSDAYDHIVLDTAPAQNALDLFTAPQRLLQFFNNDTLQSAWQFLTAATPNSFKNIGLNLVGKLMGAVAGAETLRLMLDFLDSFQALSQGMVTRSKWVTERLQGEACDLVAVVGCDKYRQVESLQRTIAFAQTMQLRMGAVMINRALPAAPVDAVSDATAWAEVLGRLHANDADVVQSCLQQEHQRQQHIWQYQQALLLVAQTLPLVLSIPALSSDMGLAEQLLALAKGCQPYMQARR